ncbi:small ribosomal subunit protein bS1m-like [Dysidea avara]|uniref:small ribosomal subunit protein bS1m-like n=1 Tax=Dysidea avara TaxID=196820 RepID=UPI00332202D9
MFRQLLLTNRWSRLTRNARLVNPNSRTVCVKWSRHIASTKTLSSEQEIPNNSQTANNSTNDIASKEKTFKDMFEASKFVNMIDPVGKIVDGKIIAVDGNKLYIDFGGKFHGVVERPVKKASGYIKGVKVNVLIKDLEIGMHFLGSNRDTSLLEASIELVGLA